MGSKNTEVGFVAFPANRTRLTLYTFLWKVPLNFPSFSLGSLLVYIGLFCQLYGLYLFLLVYIGLCWFILVYMCLYGFVLVSRYIISMMHTCLKAII